MAVFVNLSGKIIGTCKPSIGPLREVTDNVIQALCFLDYLKRYGQSNISYVSMQWTNFIFPSGSCEQDYHSSEPSDINGGTH